jgi:hypothetical protein
LFRLRVCAVRRKAFAWEIMRFPIFTACLAFTLLFAGCGTSPERRLDAPSVSISGLNSSTLSLQLANPNTAALVVNRSTHTLYIGDERIGRIDDRTAVGVPPLGSAPHIITLPSDLGEKVGARLAAATGEVRASVESSFELAVGIDDTLTLKTVGSGVVKAAQ